MTEAIDLTASKDCTAIDEVIQSSWASLQQLPDPAENEEVMAHSHEIEFGELTDLDQEADLTMPPSGQPTVAPEVPQESLKPRPAKRWIRLLNNGWVSPRPTTKPSKTNPWKLSSIMKVHQSLDSLAVSYR